MKKILFGAIAIMLTISNIAQEKQEVETLFKNGTPVGSYTGILVKPTLINGQSAMFMGGEMNLVLGHQLNVGFIGMGLISDVSANITNLAGDEFVYEMGYGGIKFEPVLYSHKLVHLTIPIILGGGGVMINQKSNLNYGNAWEYDYQTLDSDFFLIAEPGLNIEINLYKNLRLDIGAGYRFINDVSMTATKSANLEGLSGNIGLKIGWF